MDIKRYLTDKLKGAWDKTIPSALANVTIQKLEDLKLSDSNTVLDLDVCTLCIDTLENQKKSLPKLPSYFNNYKRIAGKFIDSLLKLLPELISIMSKCLNAESTDLDARKKDLGECFSALLKKCGEREVRSFTGDVWKQFISEKDGKKQSNITVQEYLIGDFASGLYTCIENTNREINNSKDIEALRKILFEDNYQLNMVDIQSKFRKYANIKFFLKRMVNRVSSKVTSDRNLSRETGHSMTALNLFLDPIERYVFGERLGRRTARSLIVIFKNYNRVLSGYPVNALDDLDQYKRACQECIKNMLEALNNYVVALEIFSKTAISVAEIAQAKQTIKVCLQKLHEVVNQAVNNDNIKSIIGDTDIGRVGNNEENKLVRIDGWALFDFLTPMKVCIDGVMTKLDTFLYPKTNPDSIDYDAFEMKNPSTKKSKSKAVLSKFSLFQNSKSKRTDEAKGLSEITEKRKYLTKILNEGIGLCNTAFKQKQNIDKIANMSNFMSDKDISNKEGGYLKSKDEILERYGALSKTYGEFCSVEWPIPGQVNKTKALLIKDNKVNDDAFNVFGSDVYSRESVSKVYSDVISYCIGKLAEMKKIKSDIDMRSKSLVETYKSESALIEKYRLEFSKLLGEIISVCKSTYGKQEKIQELSVFVETWSSAETKQKFSEAKHSIDENLYKLNHKYDSVRIYKPQSSATVYNLIDESGTITGQMNRLDLGLLKGAISYCSETLKKIKALSETILLNEAKLLKDFGGEFGKIEKARSELRALLVELKSFVSGVNENRRSFEYKRTNYQELHYPGITAKLDTIDVYFYEFNEIYVKLRRTTNLNLPETDPDKLDMEVLTQYIKNIQNSLPSLKTNYNNILADLKALEDFVLKTNKTDDSRVSSLKAKLSSIIKAYKETYNTAYDEYFTAVHRVLESGVQVSSDDLRNCLGALRGALNPLFNNPALVVDNAPGGSDDDSEESVGVQEQLDLNEKTINALNLEQLEGAVSRCDEVSQTLKFNQKAFNQALRSYNKAKEAAAKEHRELLKSLEKNLQAVHNIYESAKKAFEQWASGENDDRDLKILQNNIRDYFNRLEAEVESLNIITESYNNGTFKDKDNWGLAYANEKCLNSLQEVEKLKTELDDALKSYYDEKARMAKSDNKKSTKSSEEEDWGEEEEDVTVKDNLKDRLNDTIEIRKKIEADFSDKVMPDPKPSIINDIYQQMKRAWDIFDSKQYWKQDAERGWIVNDEKIASYSQKELADALDAALNGLDLWRKEKAKWERELTRLRTEYDDQNKKLKKNLEHIIKVFNDAADDMDKCIKRLKNYANDDNQKDFWKKLLPSNLKNKFNEMITIIAATGRYGVVGSEENVSQNITEVFPAYRVPVIAEKTINAFNATTLTVASLSCDGLMEQIDNKKKEFDKELNSFDKDLSDMERIKNS